MIMHYLQRKMGEQWRQFVANPKAL